MNKKITHLKFLVVFNRLGGNIVKTFNDHRIAMSMLIFGLASEKNIIIDDERMIKTSFPNFQKVLYSVGAKIELISK